MSDPHWPTSFTIVPAQLQPLVLPQPSQTKHEPAGRIFVPQFMHSGASAEVPMIDSSNSVELCTDVGALVRSTAVSAIASSASSGTDAVSTGADWASDSRSVSSSTIGAYEPVSSARVRSAAV